ncbi:MAG TPA: NADH-quinone oxidoreductase subunit C [Solirubrobacterales bacterium]|nr:NADH-quinone oxidoreductase subunit C [Solirubrobacterales bacterium]
MPDAPGLELIAQEVNTRHDGAVIGTSYDRREATLLVGPGSAHDVLRYLKEAPGQEYHSLVSLHAADYLPEEPRFAVHYELLNMPRVERLRVKCLIEEPPAGELPQLRTVTDLFPTAEFHEREVYDFFGIVFDGHPDLRRILLPEDYEGFPQRRDFPVGGDPVIFTNTEDEMPGWTH